MPRRRFDSQRGRPDDRKDDPRGRPEGDSADSGGRSRRQRSDEPADSGDLLAGRNPVREALEGTASVEKVLIQADTPPRFQAEYRALARAAGVPIQTVPLARLERLVPGVNHQGVVAQLAAVGYEDFDDMLRSVAEDNDAVRALKPILVLLDGIQDPHNLGAILRTAVAAGASGAVVPERGSAPLNAAALKASAGLAHRIPVARVTNLREAILQLKERGYWIVGADGTAQTSCWDQDWDRPIAIVIGSEGTGMRPSIAAACDYLVRIPMRGPAESLNASVAAGVLLFAAIRTRSDEGS